MDKPRLRKRGKIAGTDSAQERRKMPQGANPRASAPKLKRDVDEEYLRKNEAMAVQRSGIGASAKTVKTFEEDRVFHQAMEVEDILDGLDEDEPSSVRRWSKAEDDKKLDALAEETLDESRTSLMMAFRFLDAALWHMPFISGAVGLPLATDGVNLQYDALATVTRFSEDANESVRDMLHSLLHCIFRHPFDQDHPDDMAWQVATDVVVEAVAIEMCGQRYPSPDDEARKTAIGYLQSRYGTLTPPRLYRVFSLGAKNADAMREMGIDADYLRQLYSLFLRDSHNLWNRGPEDDAQGEVEPVPSDVADPDDSDDGDDATSTSNLQMTGEDQAEPEDMESDESNDLPEDESSSNDEDGQQAPGDSDETDENSDSESADQGMAHAQQVDDDTEKEWEEIAKQMEMDLGSYSKALGDEAKILMANLAAVNRRQVNYTEFLRRFSAIGEDMRVNDDEFDYLYYTYGLHLYGNMPLVEPLEYKESNRIREFVIAIDTSESTSGDLVRSFVERTYEILRQTEDFGNEVNVHILQCDTRVQSDTKITSLDQLHSYMEKFWIRGMGGTDFRPVFAYVEKMRERGEFENLKGLLYFTDGKGVFPEHRPDYDVAFVFMDDGTTQSPSVPPWSMKVMLDEERVRNL